MMHERPSQESPAQHGCPMSPQGSQDCATHTRDVDAHSIPAVGQHGWLEPPHAVQLLFRHSKPIAEHAFPAQHGCPTAPQGVHVPPAHASVSVLHADPVQQGSPDPPHVPQTLFVHVFPVAQSVPLQQDCAVAPQLPHVSLRH